MHASVNPGDFSLKLNLRFDSLLKIGVIDGGCIGTRAEIDDGLFFESVSHNIIHVQGCKNKAMLSPHGVGCASIICGKRRSVNFFSVCANEIQGVVPGAPLHTYAVGCGTKRCGLDDILITNAIDKAIIDGVKVISMSLGVRWKCAPKTSNPKDNIIGMKLLEITKGKVLPCLSVGNAGPIRRSAGNAMPWCMIVGACTNGTILVTIVEIGIKMNGKIKVKLTLEGVSLNVMDSPFLKGVFGLDYKWLKCLKFFKNPRDDAWGGECLLSADMSAKMGYVTAANVRQQSVRVGSKVCNYPVASISKEQTDELHALHMEYGDQLYIKFSKSQYREDERGVLMTSFSSRGPSATFQESIIPDVVASGYAVLMSHPTNIPIEELGKTENCIIASGTSFACPLVAAYALILYSRYPTLNPSAIKSALITTASSFPARCIPGDEFAFGAGSINLESALNPGLVYDESHDHFQEYVDKKRKMSDLNLPTFAASFSDSHLECKKVFHRRLTNITESDVEYTFEDVQYFNKSLDPEVEIKAEPDSLKFKPKETKEFELQVKIRPRCAGTHISALLTWMPSTGGQAVCSPIYLYHESKFSKLQWYEQDIIKMMKEAE